MDYLEAESFDSVKWYSMLLSENFGCICLHRPLTKHTAMSISDMCKRVLIELNML